MNREQAERLLTDFLDERGVAWARERGYVRFRVRSGGACWEMDCRYAGHWLLIYGRCPFQVSDREAALAACNEANLSLTDGAWALPEDGRPVFRTAADVEDIYDAAYRLQHTLRRSVTAVVRWWGRLERL